MSGEWKHFSTWNPHLPHVPCIGLLESFCNGDHLKYPDVCPISFQSKRSTHVTRKGSSRPAETASAGSGNPVLINQPVDRPLLPPVRSQARNSGRPHLGAAPVKSESSPAVSSLLKAVPSAPARPTQ
jgi:hypothetical protein